MRTRERGYGGRAKGGAVAMEERGPEMGARAKWREMEKEGDEEEEEESESDLTSR